MFRESRSMDVYVNTGKDKVVLTAKSGEAILDVLRGGGFVINAPCGGDGTCGKCRVLVRDNEGSSYRLACQTPAVHNVEVAIETLQPIEVAKEGRADTWLPDGDGLGVAIDVGTTTIACRLLDLSSGSILAACGRMNPQASYGSDVISRITACTDGHLDEMKLLLEGTLGDMLKEMCLSAGVDEDCISEMIIVGNTVMQHIAAGIDPAPIGVRPFKPQSLFGYEASMLDIPTYYAPCVAGYIGGDVTSGMLAVDMLRSKAPVFLLDLGTNGEMALGNEDGIFACATAAGPVFEGAGILFGMPAFPGAISRVCHDGANLQIEAIGGVDPVGICGTGLVDSIAVMLELGIVDEAGYLLDAEDIESNNRRLVGEIKGETVFHLTEKIYITQKDIRAFQLAKAAILAGIQTIIDCSPFEIGEIARVYVAGGFSSYLNLNSAVRVGLIPAQFLSFTENVGNVALEGAVSTLISGLAREELTRVAEACGYVELSGDYRFNKYYIEAMAFPDNRD